MTNAETLSRENEAIRNFLRDLATISGLPELWIHRASSEIVARLAETACRALDLELVYVSYEGDTGKIEVAHTPSGTVADDYLADIRQTLAPLLRPDQDGLSAEVDDLTGQGRLYAFALPIGADSRHGVVVAASRAPGFPDELMRLLLQAAGNQAVVILQQKEVEAQLRHNKEELSDFLENATEGLQWVGPDGIILWANRAELMMLGYTPEQYIGHPFDEFYVDADVARDVFQRLANDQPVRNFEARLRCRDGSIKYVQINSSVYRENGRFIHTRCFTRDMTQRKRMEDELELAYEEMEKRVEERTHELSATVKNLREEIDVRKRFEAEIAELRGRLVEGREAERLLLAQELHDGPIQDLFGLMYKVAALQEEERPEELHPVKEGLADVISTLRALCEELRPSTLIAFGLESAIRSHLDHFSAQYPSLQVHAELSNTGRALPEQTRLAFFRIYQQALANIARHAEASEVSIHFRMEDGSALLEIHDNGRGFRVPEHWIDFARQGHLGLIGGIERAEALGGSMCIRSAPGEGTHIEARLPVKTE